MRIKLKKIILGLIKSIFYLVQKYIMAQIDTIRNGLIDKLLAISDKNYLTALLKLVESSAISDDKIKLTKEQKLMLEMSENDINEGKIISQEDLDTSDLKLLQNYF
jgi:hypothetical protein